MTSLIDPAAHYGQSPDHISADIDGDTVLMSIEQGSYFGMNEVMTAIWAMLAEPITPDAIVAALMRQFDVTPEVCRQEVANALGELVDKGLAQRL